MDLSPSQVGRILGLTQDEVASILGVPSPQLRHRDSWTPHVRRRWQDLAELALRVEETFEPESIASWLAAPNRDLHWLIPFELLRQGRLDEVDAALEAIDSGIYV